MKNSRGFIQIVIILVVLVLVVGGAYYFGTLKNKTASVVPTLSPVASVQPSSSPTVKPTADPTANWKTFTTKDNIVSFKYPADWTVDQNTTSEGWGKDITTANLKNDKFHLMVSVANLFMNECMQEESKQNITLSGVTFYKRYFKGIFLGGYEACSSKENLENLEIWLQPTIIDKEPNNYQYGLDFIYKNANKTEGEKLFDQILSTFKFTK